MPRFVARPRIVEAWQFSGSTLLWPEAYRLVIRRHLGDGTIEIVTGDGPRVCRSGDWVMRGADGLFSVVRAAAFEDAFDEVPPVYEAAFDDLAAMNAAAARGVPSGRRR